MRLLSPITRRILAVNVMALLMIVGGMLYLADYRRSLIRAELVSLRMQAELFAAALGEGAAELDRPQGPILNPRLAKQTIRRLVEASGTRARLFAADGELLEDSRLLVGPGGVVHIEELPPPPGGEERLSLLLDLVDRALARLSKEDTLPLYQESPAPMASDYPEALDALLGEGTQGIRAIEKGGNMLSFAAPVKSRNRVVGSIMLSRTSRDIDDAVLRVRLDILKVFAVTLVITVLLSFYLAGTIARPILRLAAAAERVRRDRRFTSTIPDFGGRRDEIGQLAGALKEMTEALRSRIDAIERFAADVAHELKNPLSSLKSAVEMVGRVNDPERRRRLLTIIEDDVHRLDRLITDISDASRLDAELTRAQAETVDVGKMLCTLSDVSEATAESRGIRLRVEVAEGSRLIVQGLEGRLVQVFRNLIANALSFSPPGGEITLKAERVDSAVVAEVLDQGPGIPEGKERAIFDRFYSQRPAGEKFGIHSGLGLSISKQIVEAHGGEIRAENRRGVNGDVVGARFVVSLPAAGTPAVRRR